MIVENKVFLLPLSSLVEPFADFSNTTVDF